MLSSLPAPLPSHHIPCFVYHSLPCPNLKHNAYPIPHFPFLSPDLPSPPLGEDLRPNCSFPTSFAAPFRAEEKLSGILLTFSLPFSDGLRQKRSFSASFSDIRLMTSNWILDRDEQSRLVWLTEYEPRPEKIRSGRNGKNGKKFVAGQAAGQAVCFRQDFSTSSSRTPTVVAETSVSCTTFNILAPIYKRIGNKGCRESQFHEAWLSRNQRILDMLLLSGSSIICLQEFWLENEELVHLYEDNLNCVGYHTYKLARTNNRGDGLLTAIKSDRLRVLNYKELLFYDCGDRVAQLFYLRLKSPFYKRNQTVEQELLLVNTHLLFPHDSSFCLIRLRQVYKIIECLEHFKLEHGLSSVPVILCGDWNGSKRGHVYKFLRSQGFVSSYDTVHSYTDSDAHRWVSHRNHRGNICGVDFIWLHNPSKHEKSLSVSWREAVLGIIKAKLCEAGKDAFCFFQPKENGDMLTLHELQRRLQQLGLTEKCSKGLTREEIKDLMLTLYVDANRLIDPTAELDGVVPVEAGISDESKCLAGSFSRFQEHVKLTRHDFMGEHISDNVAGFAILDAFLFPPEVEKGSWPEDYTLSDHAPLTAVFKPLRLCD